MIDGHSNSTDLQRFVQGGLSSVDFEAHVAVCESCARALALEARLELVLEGLAKERRRASLRFVDPGRRGRFLRGHGYLMRCCFFSIRSGRWHRWRGPRLKPSRGPKAFTVSRWRWNSTVGPLPPLLSRTWMGALRRAPRLRPAS